MEFVAHYNAPPTAEQFREVTAPELAEIIREIRLADENSDDLGDAVRAAELMDSEGQTIFVARDQDGYYFASEGVRN